MPSEMPTQTVNGATMGLLPVLWMVQPRLTTSPAEAVCGSVVDSKARLGPTTVMGMADETLFVSLPSG